MVFCYSISKDTENLTGNNALIADTNSKLELYYSCLLCPNPVLSSIGEKSQKNNLEQVYVGKNLTSYRTNYD